MVGPVARSTTCVPGGITNGMDRLAKIVAPSRSATRANGRRWFSWGGSDPSYRKVWQLCMRISTAAASRPPIWTVPGATWRVASEDTTPSSSTTIGSQAPKARPTTMRDDGDPGPSHQMWYSPWPGWLAAHVRFDVRHVGST